ncbi:methyltransferase domain-containing protein [Actinoalloteichus spitiensis]|uniref:methyltransferase domain-containing protein n=1 Tax=Actinoalloteichus spitiensis TaxID=252394 RepID=UPI000372E8D8|nr:methyltransferase domain-containing protein [Actinoalloteichus spitiensis]
MILDSGRNNGVNWERYWRDITSDAGAPSPPWHFGSGAEMAPYLPVMLDHLPPELPLVDLGCGDGLLTDHLAEHYPTVVGVDVSAAAVAAARGRARPGLSFDVLDATDVDAAAELRAAFGEANVHLRGVLHAMDPADWPAALTTLATLTGRAGRVFDIEITPAFSVAVEEMLGKFASPPPGMAAVARSGLRPTELDPPSLRALYEDTGWTVVAAEELTGRSTMRLPDGSYFEYPFTYLVAGRP